MKTSDKKNYWIVGATSGIGRALAVELYKAGHQVILSGRRIENLQDIKNNYIPNAGLYPLDINDTNNVHKVFRDIIDNFGHIDSFLFFSAQYDPMAIDGLNLPSCRSIIETNYVSLFPILSHVVAHMKERQQGQIILCASVAGYIGLPNAQPYASTKAAIINMAESMRCELDSMNIDVKIISPGFVKSEMTDKNSFEMPMMITAETAAIRIFHQLNKRHKFEIKTHRLFSWIMRLLWIMPYRLYFKLIKKK